MAARPRASPTLIAYLQDLVEEAVAELPLVTRRKLLASDGWFAAGRLFALVNRQGRVVVRLPGVEDQDALLAVPGTAPWQIGEKKPMRGWLMLPEGMPDEGAGLRRWLGRAYQAAREAGAEAPAKRRRAPRKARPARKPGRRRGAG